MTRTCTIQGCNSKSGASQHRGVTFHSFPFDSKTREIWLKNCRLNPGKNITKNVFICSRHFLRTDFQSAKSNKFLLKPGAFPVIFPWVKTELENELNSDITQKSVIVSDEKSASNETPIQGPVKRTSDKVDLPESSNKIPKLSPSYNEFIAEKNVNSDQANTSAIIATEKVSMEKKLETNSQFTVGVKIEAQDFNGDWHNAKVVEVDTVDKEVLIRYDKPRKSKGGSAEEWIQMNSSRLRHKNMSNVKKPCPVFEVGEKCMARWGGARRFPATITKVNGNDSYEVLFDDGFMKTLRCHHISKIKQKSSLKPESSPKSKPPFKKEWPLISLKSLNLEELNLPHIPKDGEWCCHWVNDQPIGQEGFLMVGDYKKPTVVVEDWRLPPNWVKHMYQRSNVLGKWDVILVNPQGKRFRSKADLKQYIEEMGLVYNPDVYDFSIHRRRAKDIGAYVYTKDYKPPQPATASQTFPTQTQDTTPPTNSTNPPSSSLPDKILPKKEPIPPIQAEEKNQETLEDGYVNVGSLKVQIIDNLFRCPKERCNKNFRKENHLQIHIKHYHRDLAKLLGVCPNMQELACKRTVGTAFEEPLPKNHLPNVQFFAKLHQQDLAQKVHRKLPVAPATPNVSSSLSEIQSPDANQSIDLIKKETPEVFSSTPLLSSSLEITTSKNKFLSGYSALTEKTEPPTGGNTQLSVMRDKKKRQISGDSSNHKGSRKKIAKKNVSSLGVVSYSSIGVSDQEETRHSFSGNSDIKVFKKIKSETVSGLSEATLDATSQSHTIPSLPDSHSPKYINENGELIKIVRMRQEEIINCLCSFGEEDGLMIQCELCLCWQHGICNGIEKESQVPEKYICYICRNPQRGRTSLKYIHDQDWMYEGKLPVASYHALNPNLEKRFETLRKTHVLTGNLLELKKFMHSLKVKINIAENKDHPKMYLWSNKWESSNDLKSEIKSAIDKKTTEIEVIKKEQEKEENKPTAENQTMDKYEKEIVENQILTETMNQPTVPQPEAAIDPVECQRRLLEHIKNQQLCVMDRLETIESQIAEIESLDKADVSDDENYSKTKEIISMYIKDLETMKNIAKINTGH